MAAGKPDFWDHATLLELAALAKDRVRAEAALGDALAAVPEVWEPESTARNLRLIREAQVPQRGSTVGIPAGAGTRAPCGRWTLKLRRHAGALEKPYKRSQFHAVLEGVAYKKV